MGYDVKLQSDNKGQVRGYAIKRGNSIYKSSELGKGRCLMPSKIDGKVDDADIEKLTDARKKLIGDESKLLEDHRKENIDILTRHFYDMSNMMSRNEGVWLSNGWVKTLLWIFLPCFLYAVISIVYFVASYIDK